MSLTAIPGFCDSSYFDRSRAAAACRTVNWRLERNRSPLAKSPFTLYPREGKRLFAIMPEGPNRGAWQNKSRVFVHAGTKVYELFIGNGGVTPTGANSSATNQGTVPPGTNPTTMRSNGNQLVICAGGIVYVATGTTLYQPIVNYAGGTVSVAGNIVTWVDGDKFTAGMVGDFIMLDTKLFTVAGFTNATHITVNVAPPPFGTDVEYQVGTEMLTGATVEFLDGYFIVNIPNSKDFRISNLFNGKKWDELDKGTKSTSTDNIATVMDLGGQLALIGDTKSTEIWRDSGNLDFPFARVGGNNLNAGADAAWSVTRMIDGSLCWLVSYDQGGGIVVRTSGGEPQRISDHKLEYALQKYALLSDAIGYSYVDANGHCILRLTFPTANRSWEFDMTTSEEIGRPVWTEVGTATAEDEVYAADAAYFHAYVTWPNGQRMHLGFDFQSGDVWELSSDFKKDLNTPIPLLRVAPHLVDGLDRTTNPEFALDCELGTHDPSDAGPDGKERIPTVQLLYSDDGGFNWTDAGAASLGRSGEYQGTELSLAEMQDTTPGSQTNPQTWQARPRWEGLADFWVSRTFKIKATAEDLRAVYAAYGLFGK